MAGVIRMQKTGRGIAYGPPPPPFEFYGTVTTKQSGILGTITRVDTPIIATHFLVYSDGSCPNLPAFSFALGFVSTVFLNHLR